VVRNLLTVVLQRHGFRVWSASGGNEAIDLFRLHGGEIGLVLLDVRMPGLDGPQTLAALQALRPDVRCCFMSGHTGPYAEQELLGRGAVRVFAKPFRVEELGPTLWQLAHRMERVGA
jgi:CheY-like chemotaxis protein